ncbi:MAG: NAD(P)-dependent oxidoreductase [Alphaproteobacteria bacterium]|nr:NAD(P)-dependent oxidoreductase [Alphaproteobacteria bacterium]
MGAEPSDKTEHAVAVTGAGGFLGGLIAHALADAGHRVIALGRHAPIVGDRRIVSLAWDGRTEAPSNLRVDVVVDCAAAIPARLPDPDLLMATNVALARGAIELAARSCGRVVFMSSQSAIGRVAVPVIDELTPCAPDTPYGHAKLQAERMLADSVATGTLAGAVALRLPAVVGVGSHDNFPSAVAARLVANDTVTVFNPDGPYNAVVHASSVARFAHHLIVAAGERFDAVSLASRPPITVADAVRAIADGLGVVPRFVTETARHPSPIIDPSGAVALGYRPEAVDAALRRYGAETRIAIATPPPPR